VVSRFQSNLHKAVVGKATYAAVAATISTFLALLSRARSAEQRAEKAAIQPSLASGEGMKYKTTIDKIGRRDDMTIASNLTSPFILLSETVSSSEFRIWIVRF
jgi:hypothetical protein